MTGKKNIEKQKNKKNNSDQCFENAGLNKSAIIFLLKKKLKVNVFSFICALRVNFLRIDQMAEKFLFFFDSMDYFMFFYKP